LALRTRLAWTKAPSLRLHSGAEALGLEVIRLVRKEKAESETVCRAIFASISYASWVYLCLNTSSVATVSDPCGIGMPNLLPSSRIASGQSRV